MAANHKNNHHQNAPSKAARILIVEDREADRLSLQRMLEAEGYKVRVASNGLEALAAVRSFRPQVILLDVNLPVYDGYQVCEHIRLTAPGKHAWIYGTTRLRRDLVRARRAGFDAVLAKPIDARALAALVGLK